jgi:nucleoside-diphosphate-sugar epimerase
MDTTILVTGATGFVGGAVAAQLPQRPEVGRVLLIRGARYSGNAARGLAIPRVGGQPARRHSPGCRDHLAPSGGEFANRRRKLSTQVWRERIMKYEPISMWR